MGIDWEYLLNAEGERLERAYNDAIPEPDDFFDDFDEYYDEDFYESESDGEAEEAPAIAGEPANAEATVPAEPVTAELMDHPLHELSAEQKIALFHLNDCRASYLISIMKGERNRWKGRNRTLEGADGNSYPACDRLFHANSVRTSIEFIRRKALLSRAFGENEIHQTTQRSDDLDKQLGIYNDIFFDNIDIPSRCGTNRSAYGPIMFVFKVDILKGHPIRILKCNPWSAENMENLSYNDLFFSDVDEIRNILIENHQMDQNRVDFLSDFNHHTTVFNTSELPFGDFLEAIYLEKSPNDTGLENAVKDHLEYELGYVGLDVPVVIRNNPPNAAEYGLAAAYEELWEDFPEDH